MRENGATLQEIGDYFGVTRERIRQILNTYYPQGKPLLAFSTFKCARLLGCSRDTFFKYASDLGFNPTRRGKRQYCWTIEAVFEVYRYMQSKECIVCGEPVPIKQKFCKSCAKERWRYRNSTPEAKPAHLFTKASSAAPAAEAPPPYH